MRTPLAVLALAAALLASPEARAGDGSPGAAAAKVTGPASDLVVWNRTIVTFRAPILGVSAADRATRAEVRIHELLSRRGNHEVSLKSTPIGQVVALDGASAFALSPEDVDPLGDETLDDLARRAAATLAQVAEETREVRNVRALFYGFLAALAATAIFLLLVWGIRRGTKAAARKVTTLVERHGSRLHLGDAESIVKVRLVSIAGWVVKGVSWLVIALLAYEWVGYVLGRFPYTRPWGEGLVRFLGNLIAKIAQAVVGAIPGIVLAVIIFAVARFAVGISDSLFDRAVQGGIKARWLDADTVRPTRRIVSAIIWVFALAMAYPYLPGAQTEAFKGLSVLLGLMFSLGATSLVGQAAAGLIIMYTRTLRAGEYVRMNEFEGTVVESGLFVTRIRTGLGEELTISNSLIVGSVTKNYSRAVKGPGFVLDTVVTIGYDAPWRQVEAMLLEAALRTEGVVQDPPSRVHQTALSDFYVEYRLVTYAIPERPVPRALILSALHAHIQDVFNEHGVQIMSPHYLGDPASPKLVPPSGWYPPPARSPGGGTPGPK
jgi:small-conductance mechanosensitive channel